MKFSAPPLLRAGLVTAALLLGAGAARAADDDSGNTARVKFSNPGKPGTLKLAFPWAEVRIHATDGNEVVVTSSLDQKGGREIDREGFRRLDEDVTFELVEKDNVATIAIGGDNPWASQGAEFDIRVPRSTNLVLRTEVGGDIDVTGVEGDIDINSMNGEVTLRDLSSSAIVNTMNGEIRASFAKAPVKPVSLSSMNGEIDLRLPKDTKANLRMRTHNGSVRTNFAEGALQTRTEKNPRSSVSVSVSTAVSIASDVERQIAREMARADREHARVQREMEQVRERHESARVRRDADENENDNANGIAPPAPPTPATPATPVAAPAPVAPVTPVPPVPGFGGKSIVGTLNGGGVDIKLTSMNGTITLREAK